MDKSTGLHVKGSNTVPEPTTTKVVHKYPIGPQPTYLYLPEFSRVVHFGEQEGEFKIWVECDVSKPARQYIFEVYGTGWAIPSDRLYLSTFCSKEYVWHLYEDVRNRPPTT